MAPGPLRGLLLAPWFALVARMGLTCPFWMSGVLKLADWRGAVLEIQNFGLEPAAPIALLVVGLQLICSLSIILNRWVWLSAGALAMFTAAATVLAHPFWLFPDTERFLQRNIFLEHVSIIAGLMLAAALAEHRPSGTTAPTRHPGGQE